MCHFNNTTMNTPPWQPNGVPHRCPSNKNCPQLHRMQWADGLQQLDLQDWTHTTPSQAALAEAWAQCGVRTWALLPHAGCPGRHWAGPDSAGAAWPLRVSLWILLPPLSPPGRYPPPPHDPPPPPPPAPQSISNTPGSSLRTPHTPVQPSITVYIYLISFLTRNP